MSNFLKLIEAYGSGQIQLLSKKPFKRISKDDVISTGSLAMDIASGIGGWPRNRVVEVFGNESSGKTTLATMACAEFNREGLYASYIDVEHAFDPRYAVALGVKPDLFSLSQPSSAEEALQLAIDSASTDDCGIVVLDSVAGLITKQELEGDLDDANIGATARLMGRSLRKLIAVCSVNRTLMMFINQNRDKVGVMFGSPKTQPGGRALKFFSSMRVEFARLSTEKDKKQNNEAISNQTQATFIKNKLGTPYRVCEFDIVFGEGIDNWKSAVEIGTKEGVITKKGNTFSYKELTLGVGVKQAAQAIKDNPDIYRKIRRAVLKKDEEQTEEEKEDQSDKPIRIKKKKKREVSVTENGEPRVFYMRSVLKD